MNLSWRLRAPAKVNLSLEILGKRPDGFHEIRSVVQTISLFDTLEAEPSASLSLLAPASTGPVAENLALLAAIRLRALVAPDAGAMLRLTKGIPVSAGLGGGSSDAAAALRLLARVWRAHTSESCLTALASELGSDVALFLGQAAGDLRGHGEQVQPLPALSQGCFVVVCPDWTEPHKTAQVYGAVEARDYTDGAACDHVAQRLQAAEALHQEHLENHLEPAAQRVFPELAEWRAQVEALTSRKFILSGAGPSLFHLAESTTIARDLAGCLKLGRGRVLVARPLTGLTRIVRSNAPGLLDSQREPFLT